GLAYNMCNNGAYCGIAELAEMLRGLFPEKGLRVARLGRAADDAYSEDRTADIRRVDCSRLRGLGWRPRVGLREGFERTVRSFLEGR
ncbi:MAG: hypothetical protein LBP92_04625, partial [Deltaproteobacteria bacterium]|nr:hypothetical protein [Deltaproteobacteria bacterium]